nr:coiled-coil domain-containing protein 187 [Globicephala melas]
MDKAKPCTHLSPSIFGCQIPPGSWRPRQVQAGVQSSSTTPTDGRGLWLELDGGTRGGGDSTPFPTLTSTLGWKASVRATGKRHLPSLGRGRHADPEDARGFLAPSSLEEEPAPSEGRPLTFGNVGAGLSPPDLPGPGGLGARVPALCLPLAFEPWLLPRTLPRTGRPGAFQQVSALGHQPLANVLKKHTDGTCSLSASPSKVPSGAGEPRQAGAPGQEDGAEPDGWSRCCRQGDLAAERSSSGTTLSPGPADGRGRVPLTALPCQGGRAGVSITVLRVSIMGQGTSTDRHPELGRSQLALSEDGCRAADHGAALGKEDSLPLPAAEGEVMAAVSWPEPSQQAGAQRGSPHVAWSDFPEEPGPRQKARSLLVWLTDEEAKDGDSSVSSGRLSGSSGGHESCTPPHGTWKERTLRVLGPLQQPRESTPRLEQLREKIRAQARWQASCTSLGTSAPASASDLYKARTPAPRRKARKPTHPAPALAYPGSGILSGAESGVEDKATPCQGREASRVSQRQASVPREKTKRMKSRSCKREKTPKLPAPRRAAKDTGANEDSELVGVYAWRKEQALVRVLLGPPPSLPRLPPRLCSARGGIWSVGLRERCPGSSGIGVRARHLSPSDPSDALQTPHQTGTLGSRSVQKPRKRISVPERHPFGSQKAGRGHQAFLTQGLQDGNHSSSRETCHLPPRPPPLVFTTFRGGGSAPGAQAQPQVTRRGTVQNQRGLRERGGSGSAPPEALQLWPPLRLPVFAGHGKKLGAGESSPVCPRLPRSTSARSAPQVSTNAPHLASCHQPVNIQAAMAVLRDLHQQIQASLELAQGHHPRRGLEPRDLAGRRWQSPWKPPDLRGSWKSPRAVTEGVPASKRAGSLPMALSWSASARWESYPQRTWAAQGRDPSFRGPGSPTERLNSFPQRPWSASARRTSCPPKTWAAQGWDRSLWRPGSIPERWGPFLQQPRSTSSGQAWGLQRAWTSCEDREGPARRPWSPAFTQGPDPRCQGRGPLLTPAGAKLTWPRPSQGALWNMPGKENEVRPPPPCPKPRGPLHSSESLREFIQQKMEPWWQQALKEKASATQALELRNQRLQGVYRKQREAVPVVSQTTPGIVTFVPHSAQSGGLEATGGPGAPVPQWSRVTSGMVLGDQDAPGSFCLCLNRALNPAETLEVGGPRDGWEGAPLLTSASSSLGPLQLQGLTSHCSSPGLCICLDPEESERLGAPGPLHFRYKQARLQALETMANVLKQRIDVLTDRLSRSEATDAAGGPVPGPPPSSSSTPACPRALVPSAGGGAPWDWAGMRARPLLSTMCFPDTETLTWSPGWGRLQSVSPRGRQASKPQGFMEDGRSEWDKRQARTLASLQTLSRFAGSSLGAPDPRCGSLRLEEMRSARGAGLVTPLTLRSCGKGEPVDRPWAGWSGGQGDPLGTRSTA